jgi:cupin domain
MVVQSAVFGPGMYSLVHHRSGVEAVYVLEGEACYETPGHGFTLRKGETLAVPANTPMRALVPRSTTRRYVDAGFDVFAMDLQGYGRSSKPTVMDDPCNTSAGNQAKYLVPDPLPVPCPPR